MRQKMVFLPTVLRSVCNYSSAAGRREKDLANNVGDGGAKRRKLSTYGYDDDHLVYLNAKLLSAHNLMSKTSPPLKVLLRLLLLLEKA